MTRQQEEHIRECIQETDNDYIAFGLELILFYERYGINDETEEGMPE